MFCTRTVRAAENSLQNLIEIFDPFGYGQRTLLRLANYTQLATRIVLHGWHVTRVQAEVRQIGQPPQQRIVIDFELAGFPAPFQAALHFER